jgi:hypothetical protein
MRKLSLAIATVLALAFSALPTQPARADAGATIAIIAVGSWGWCHLTYGQARQTGLCWWHDSYHQRVYGTPAKKGKKGKKKAK